MVGLLSNSTKIRKPPGLVGGKNCLNCERISKKQNGLIIISVLSVSDKKTSCQ